MHHGASGVLREALGCYFGGCSYTRMLMGCLVRFIATLAWVCPLSKSMGCLEKLRDDTGGLQLPHDVFGVFREAPAWRWRV